MPLTQEDLEQIREVVSAAISAHNQVLFAAMRAMEEPIDQSIRQLRDELSGRIENVERRLDRLDSRFMAFEFQLAGIGKPLTAGERLNGEMRATQAAVVTLVHAGL